MSKKERATTHSERCKTLIRHVQQDNPHYIATECSYHMDRPCFLLLNSYDEHRYHCLYLNYSVQWVSISLTRSCDLPELFHDLIKLYELLGVKYVLPFSGHFRESSGYTIGMFRTQTHLYPPSIIGRHAFKETVYAFIIFFCAISHRLGGNVPNMQLFSFVYTASHPVLCDIGSSNVEARERLRFRREHFNRKKWTRLMRHKTTRDIIRYLRLYFPHFFQKKKKQKQCVLNDGEEPFDCETHRLVCQSSRKSLLDVVKEFAYLMPEASVSRDVIDGWVQDLENAA